MSGATVNRELVLLKHMFNLAINWDLHLGSNPLRKVKYFQEVNTGFRVLSQEEETRLLRNATPLAARGLGQRSDQHGLAKDSEGLRRPHQPGRAPDSGVRKLGRKNEFVFYNQKTGEPFVDLDAGLQLACEKAEISGVTWHTLRHTFASRLLERGVDTMTVKELLGHSSLVVTMRYTHSNLTSKVVAVGKLGETATIQPHPAPKCSSSNPKCSKLAANSKNTLELKTEEWVSG